MCGRPSKPGGVDELFHNLDAKLFHVFNTSVHFFLGLLQLNLLGCVLCYLFICSLFLHRFFVRGFACKLFFNCELLLRSNRCLLLSGTLTKHLFIQGLLPQPLLLSLKLLLGSRQLVRLRRPGHVRLKLLERCCLGLRFSHGFGTLLLLFHIPLPP